MHLSASNAENLIKVIKPEKAILTHFGMTMLKTKPFIVAREISQHISIETVQQMME
jgi:phosphoribosyl 1,2-cyclic phosphodiesterase